MLPRLRAPPRTAVPRPLRPNPSAAPGGAVGLSADGYHGPLAHNAARKSQPSGL